MDNVSADVSMHWTRAGVLERIDAALAEQGHDPANPPPDVLSAIDHLHTGGLATTVDQAALIELTAASRVIDVGCGIGGPARYLALKFGCRVDGIDLTPELVESGNILSRRCGLADKVRLVHGNALELPYPDQTFDVAWCQNVTMNIPDKTSFLTSIQRVLKPGGIFTSTEFSTGPGGDVMYPVQWAYDASISFLDSEAVMRSRLENARFRIREWRPYSDVVIARMQQAAAAPAGKLTNVLVYGEDAAVRQRSTMRNLVEKRLMYWMVTAQRM